MRGLNIRCNFAMLKIRCPGIIGDSLEEALEGYPPDSENPIRRAYEMGESDRFKVLTSDAVNFERPSMFADEPLLLSAWKAGYDTICQSILNDVAYALWEKNHYDNFINQGNPSEMCK